MGRLCSDLDSQRHIGNSMRNGLLLYIGLSCVSTGGFGEKHSYLGESPVAGWKALQSGKNQHCIGPTPAHFIKPRIHQKVSKKCNFDGFRRVPGQLVQNYKKYKNRPFRRALNKIVNKLFSGGSKMFQHRKNVVPQTSMLQYVLQNMTQKMGGGRESLAGSADWWIVYTVAGRKLGTLFY